MSPQWIFDGKEIQNLQAELERLRQAAMIALGQIETYHELIAKLGPDVAYRQGIHIGLNFNLGRFDEAMERITHISHKIGGLQHGQ